MISGNGSNLGVFGFCHKSLYLIVDTWQLFLCKKGHHWVGNIEE